MARRPPPPPSRRRYGGLASRDRPPASSIRARRRRPPPAFDVLLCCKLRSDDVIFWAAFFRLLHHLFHVAIAVVLRNETRLLSLLDRPQGPVRPPSKLPPSHRVFSVRQRRDHLRVRHETLRVVSAAAAAAAAALRLRLQLRVARKVRRGDFRLRREQQPHGRDRRFRQPPAPRRRHGRRHVRHHRRRDPSEPPAVRRRRPRTARPPRTPPRLWDAPPSSPSTAPSTATRRFLASARADAPRSGRRTAKCSRGSPPETSQGRSIRSDDVGVELKGVRSGVERRRGRGLKARDPGRRDAPGKVLKDRRSPRERGRMGTSV